MFVQVGPCRAFRVKAELKAKTRNRSTAVAPWKGLGFVPGIPPRLLEIWKKAYT